MAPIRNGDGTGLAAKGFSQIRKGDGTVLWNAIPATFVSRPDDDNDHNSNGDPRGVRVEAVSEWPKFEVELSGNNDDPGDLVVYDSDGNQVGGSIDISSENPGDVVEVDINLGSGAEYNIVTENGGQVGVYDADPGFPLDDEGGGDDIRMINGADGVTSMTNVPYAFTKVGNISGNL